ncbi:MAG: dTDP-4-dehydrorhamnose 3,5-epimerase [Actinobacteria bacterium]|nr:MAG: dTDP-4-dehydrorhamnose 3,5-epimerase [Actinomycetota bacterium]
MIEGVQTKKLKVLRDERGYLMEMLRSDDPFFAKFGQVYLSVCNPGWAKAWHWHELQTDRFVIVRGNARVVLHDLREDSRTRGETNEFEMGEGNPLLLVIPPRVAHGYTPIGDEACYLVNTPTEPYNYERPDELRLPFDDPSICYDWGVSHGG